MTSFAKLKRIFFFFAKLAIAGGIVAYLALRNPAEIIDGFRSFNCIWLAPALIFYLAHMLVCAWRWHRLTRILGIELSGAEALSLTMQGYFFSLVIPGGAIGGDVVKMGVLSKRTPSGSKIEGAFTILMDRIIGMIALFVLALLLLIPAIPVLMKIDIPNLPINDNLRILIIVGLAGLCLAGLAASCVIFLHRFIEKLPLFGSLMKWGNQVTHGLVSRLTAATDLYLGCPTELILLVVISIFFVHLMTVVPFAFLLWGMHVSFSLLTLIVAVTIGNIMGLIPLFPAGVGGRDVTIVTILVAGAITVGDAKAGQLLYTAIVLLFNLIGSLFFVFDPGRKTPKPQLETEQDPQEANHG